MASRSGASEPSPKRAGGGWQETVRGFMEGLTPFLPELGEAARRTGLIKPTIGGPPALPSGAGPERDAAIAINPAFKGILDALVVELQRKPSPDLPGLAAFLESILLDEDTTLLDRLATIARAPEHLARIPLRHIDPRLVEADTWPGVKALMAYLREEAAKADA